MVYLGKSKEKDMFFGAKPELFRFAQEMRKNPTESEERLWSFLRQLRNEGFVFRRQHPIDLFIADFYCHKLKLVIEVDGEVHDDEEVIEHDDGRTGELEKYGIRVLRFRNAQVLDNLTDVSNQIQEYISEISAEENI
jgi:very-short-patch-repair endonuclease